MEAAYDAWLVSAYRVPGPQLPSSVEEFLDELEERPGDTRHSTSPWLDKLSSEAPQHYVAVAVDVAEASISFATAAVLRA